MTIITQVRGKTPHIKSILIISELNGYKIILTKIYMKLKDALFLRRKAMTNLDSVSKRRDITLLTKVRIVKAMVFPVVMYGCEDWTIKKAEH